MGPNVTLLLNHGPQLRFGSKPVGWRHGSRTVAGRTHPSYRPIGPNDGRFWIDGAEYEIHRDPDAEYAIQQAIYNSREFRFETRQADFWPPDVGDNPRNRAEFASRVKYLHFRPFWLGWEFMWEKGPINTAEFMIFGQMHSLPAPEELRVSPVWAHYARGQDLCVETCASTDEPITSNPPRIEHFRFVNFERGIWHRFLYRLYITYGTATASMRAWHNGIQFLDLKNIQMGLVDPLGQILQFGIYRSDVPEWQAARYRNLYISLYSPAPEFR